VTLGTGGEYIPAHIHTRTHTGAHRHAGTQAHVHGDYRFDKTSFPLPSLTSSWPHFLLLTCLPYPRPGLQASNGPHHGVLYKRRREATCRVTIMMLLGTFTDRKSFLFSLALHRNSPGLSPLCSPTRPLLCWALFQPILPTPSFSPRHQTSLLFFLFIRIQKFSKHPSAAPTSSSLVFVKPKMDGRKCP